MSPEGHRLSRFCISFSRRQVCPAGTGVLECLLVDAAGHDRAPGGDKTKTYLGAVLTKDFKEHQLHFAFCAPETTHVEGDTFCATVPDLKRDCGKQLPNDLFLQLKSFPLACHILPSSKTEPHGDSRAHQASVYIL